MCVCVCVNDKQLFMRMCSSYFFYYSKKTNLLGSNLPPRLMNVLVRLSLPFARSRKEKKAINSTTTHTGIIIITILLLLILHVGTKIVQRVSRSFRCRRRRRSLKQSTLFWSCTLFSWYWTAAVCAFRTCFETRSTVGSTKRTRICTQTSSSDVTRC